MPLRTYRKLDVWTVAMELVESAYHLGAELPADEKFGLRSQIQRSAASIPAHIAEGYGRGSRADYRHHLIMARGSPYELETHLTIAAWLHLVQRRQAVKRWRLVQRVGKMLMRLIASLETETRNPKPETRDQAQGPAIGHLTLRRHAAQSQIANRKSQIP